MEGIELPNMEGIELPNMEGIELPNMASQFILVSSFLTEFQFK